MMKKITFIIIAYNEAEKIKNCIDSILNQDDLKKINFEILVVSDGSTDDTVSIVNNISHTIPEVRAISLKENRGRGFARYKGVKEATGDYMAFVDADILLPKNWMAQCLLRLENYDAVGGLALPASDIEYVYYIFHLTPKAVAPVGDITGNNAIFRRKIFETLKFNNKMKDGEDVDLNWRMQSTGFKTFLVPNLFVQHKDNVTYVKAIIRMYEYGIGATKLLNKHKIIRMPDLTYFFFVFLILASTIIVVLGKYFLLYILFFYPLLISTVFLYQRFKIDYKKIYIFILASVANYCLMVSYYVGRTVGLVKQ